MRRARRARRARIARVVAFSWLMASGPARAVAGDVPAEPVTSEAAAVEAATSAGGCASWLSCGSGCSAELVTGVCILTVQWSGGVQVGGIQIGPQLGIECSLCECWYTYLNADENKLFKRTTRLSCGGSLSGVEVYLE